jgi:hypothetical protein
MNLALERNKVIFCVTHRKKELMKRWRRMKWKKNTDRCCVLCLLYSELYSSGSNKNSDFFVVYRTSWVSQLIQLLFTLSNRAIARYFQLSHTPHNISTIQRIWGGSTRCCHTRYFCWWHGNTFTNISMMIHRKIFRFIFENLQSRTWKLQKNMKWLKISNLCVGEVIISLDLIHTSKSFISMKNKYIFRSSRFEILHAWWATHHITHQQQWEKWRYFLTMKSVSLYVIVMIYFTSLVICRKCTLLVIYSYVDDNKVFFYDISQFHFRCPLKVLLFS